MFMPMLSHYLSDQFSEYRLVKVWPAIIGNAKKYRYRYYWGQYLQEW